jgi:hypothetical protein
MEFINRGDSPAQFVCVCVCVCVCVYSSVLGVGEGASPFIPASRTGYLMPRSFVSGVWMVSAIVTGALEGGGSVSHPRVPV